MDQRNTPLTGFFVFLTFPETPFAFKLQDLQGYVCLVDHES